MSPLPLSLLAKLAEAALSEAPGQSVDTYRSRVSLQIVQGHPLLGANRYLMPKQKAIIAAVQLAMGTWQLSAGRPPQIQERLPQLAGSIVANGKGRTLVQLKLDMRDALRREFGPTKLPKGLVENTLLAALQRQHQEEMSAAAPQVWRSEDQAAQVATEFTSLRETIEKFLARLRQPATPEAERASTGGSVRSHLIALSALAVNGVQKHAVERLQREFQALQCHGPDPLAPGQAQRVHWHILKPSGHSWTEIVSHYERLSRLREERFDLQRLKAVHEFGPDEIFIGTESFEGYVVFCFVPANLAALECPQVGNALYLMRRSEWKTLSQLSKSDLLADDQACVSRIIHAPSWKKDLAAAFHRHGLRE